MFAACLIYYRYKCNSLVKQVRFQLERYISKTEGSLANQMTLTEMESSVALQIADNNVVSNSSIDREFTVKNSE